MRREELELQPLGQHIPASLSPAALLCASFPTLLCNLAEQDSRGPGSKDTFLWTTRLFLFQLPDPPQTRLSLSPILSASMRAPPFKPPPSSEALLRLNLRGRCWASYFHSHLTLGAPGMAPSALLLPQPSPSCLLPQEPADISVLYNVLTTQPNLSSPRRPSLTSLSPSVSTSERTQRQCFQQGSSRLLGTSSLLSLGTSSPRLLAHPIADGKGQAEAEQAGSP